MTIIFLAFAILPLLIPHLFTKKIKVKAQEWSQNNQQYIARQHEFIDYKRVIKNFRVESIAIRIWVLKFVPRKKIIIK